ncbi:MAG: hypothetical protein A2Y23_09920 [Clostridiales bacterium GWB2_37_7]|nr:MAG: hypothetical protein A2Y23_09920 [Clostridiales bacterium GWB2_37_7]
MSFETLKKTLAYLFVVMLLIFSVPNVVQAADDTATNADQEEEMSGKESEMVFVPLRASLELIGIKDVNWVQEDRKIIFKQNDDEFAINIEKAEVFINGEAEPLSSIPKIESGATYIQIDFFTKNLSVDPAGELYQKIYSLSGSIIEQQVTYEQNLRKNIISTALKFVGAPYIWGAAGPSAFDSSGLIWYTFKKNGINLPRVSFDIYKAGKPISKAELLPGDVVFFQGYKKGPSHATIFAGDGKFIHSPSTGKRVSVSSLLNDKYYWGPKFYGARRYIDVN